jgi:hypothetical protein
VARDLGTVEIPGRLKVSCTKPFIIDWRLTLIATGESVKDKQVDVRSTLLCEITIEDQSGWERKGGMHEVHLSAWFDEGDDARYRYYSIDDSDAPAYYCHNDSAPGANFNFKFVYNHTQKTFNIVWPRTGEVVLHSKYCGYKLSNPFNGTIWFLFTLGNQTKHAHGGGNGGTTAWKPGNCYNDPYSWNINITVIDQESLRDYVIGEFGVYRYTAIYVSELYPKLSGVPGQRACSPTFALRDISNDAYWLNVSVKTDLRLLTDRTVRISTEYMSFNSTIPTDGVQNVTGGAQGWSGVFRDASAPRNNTYQEILGCRYEVFIPMGTYGGTYTTAVLYTVVHK